MKLNYESLDAAILKAVEEGHNQFARIFAQVKALAQPMAKPDRWGLVRAELVVDRRLQALRKKSAIICKGNKWSRVKTEPSSGDTP